MITVLFDGLAWGTLLFVLAVGLSVTLGLMNFVNLAHGAFAMLGGYVTAALLNRWGVPFLLCLPVAAAAAAVMGFILERTLYARLYEGASHLDQVLFSIGLVFMAMAVADYLMGARQQIVHMPAFLSGQVRLAPGIEVGAYRLFLIGVCGALALGLHFFLVRTRFGSTLRAGVDNARVARALGIDVGRIFSITFAAGSALAGLGGALGADILSLDPTFPVKYMVFFLVVVAVGGSGTVTGPLVASLLLGICDAAGKYYLPQIGAFIIYAVMVAVLILKPHGLFGRAVQR